MKRIVTSFSLVILCISFLTFPVINASAQTPGIIYSQNFDSTIHPVLPTGWSATPNGWIVDTTLKNASTGAYPLASGLNNVVINNATGLNGTFELVSNSISTLNYTNITVEWAARNTKHFADSGSYVKGFYYSTNGTTWDSIPYTENQGNSDWAIDNNAAPISLPAGAANQATVWFKWVTVVFSNSQGTYRIDDFNVGGIYSPANGIKPVNAVEPNKLLGNVFVSNRAINIYSNSQLNEKVNVEVFNVLGNVVKSTTMNSSKLVLNTSGLSSGIYFVRLSTATTSTVNKVVLN
jgi:hypothetical protein